MQWLSQKPYPYDALSIRRGGHRCLLRVQVAAMGRLALIADALGETAVAATVRGNMKAVLAPWLGDTNADKLQYDPSWGGVCSSAGLADGELASVAISMSDLTISRQCHSLVFSESTNLQGRAGCLPG